MTKDLQGKLKNELKTQALKELVGWSNGDLIAYIVDLRQEINDLKGQLNKSSSDDTEQNELLTENKFKQDWSYPTKIHFLLELHQKPLTSEDLHTLLLKIDDHYKKYNAPRNNLSVALGRVCKSGRIKKMKQPGIKLKYFALPEWMNEKSELKQEFTRYLKLFRE
ncbi:hypothetical protein CNR22_21350 [Sphingobacteriaceae bacterium]|nr:hypothetical protein CNR22_21350 [Sphingobacteriaceae bacterium]